MSDLTIRDAKRRSGLNLKSDLSVAIYDPLVYLRSVRSAERRQEARNTAHRVLRLAAIEHFRRRRLDVYPNGVTVDGAGTCLDLAIFRGNQIIFIECLTAGWITGPNIAKKRRIERHAPLVFVIEDRERTDFETGKKWRWYSGRLASIARRNETYLCSLSKPRLQRITGAG